MRPYKVYKLTNKSNGKIYIGLTKRTVKKRLQGHVKSAKEGKCWLLSRAIRKYGIDNFTVDIVASELTSEEACAIEVDLISSLKANSGRGYNIMDGGQTGTSSRIETKQKKSIAAKKNWKENKKVRDAIYSPCRLKKISEASKKNWEDPEYRRKILTNKNRLNTIKNMWDDETKKKAKDTYIKNGHNSTVRNITNNLIFDTFYDAQRWIAKNTKYNKASASNIHRACVTGGKAYGFNWVVIDNELV